MCGMNIFDKSFSWFQLQPVEPFITHFEKAIISQETNKKSKSRILQQSCLPDAFLRDAFFRDLFKRDWCL